jgi:hypothetical protein
MATSPIRFQEDMPLYEYCYSCLNINWNEHWPSPPVWVCFPTSFKNKFHVMLHCRSQCWICNIQMIALFSDAISQTIWHQMVGWWMNNELEIMWEETVVAWVMALSQNLPGGTEDSLHSDWDSNGTLEYKLQVVLLSQSAVYSHVSCVSCHPGMTHPQVQDGGQPVADNL